MKKLVYCSMAVVLLFSVMVVAHSFAVTRKMIGNTRVSNVSEYDSNLKHYVWETARPPYGPCDMISLHRFIHQRHNWEDDSLQTQ